MQLPFLGAFAHILLQFTVKNCQYLMIVPLLKDLLFFNLFTGFQRLFLFPGVLTVRNVDISRASTV